MLKFKTNKTKKEYNDNLKRISLYMIPVIGGFSLFALIFGALALYTYNTGIINTFTIISGWLSFGIGAFFTGIVAHKNLGGRGFATGAVYGIIYCAVSLAAILLISKSDSAGIFIAIPISVVFSMLGGIADSVNKH